MLLGALELFDFAILFGMLVLLMAWRGRGAVPYVGPAERERLKRLEAKLDMIMSHLGLEYTAPAKAAWQGLADDPSRKIAAVKAYREQYGVGLAEAKQAVEDYIRGRTN
jgi:hypothetical protein